MKGFLPGTGYLSEIIGQSEGTRDLWETFRTEGFSSGWARFVEAKGWLPLAIAPFLILLFTIYAGSVIGGIALIRERKFFTLIFLTLPIFYFLILPGAPTNSRFRIPAMPYFDLLAAYGIIALYGAIQSRRKRHKQIPDQALAGPGPGDA